MKLNEIQKLQVVRIRAFVSEQQPFVVETYAYTVKDLGTTLWNRKHRLSLPRHQLHKIDPLAPSNMTLVVNVWTTHDRLAEMRKKAIDALRTLAINNVLLAKKLAIMAEHEPSAREITP